MTAPSQPVVRFPTEIIPPIGIFKETLTPARLSSRALFRGETVRMTMIRLVGDTWVVEDSGRRVAQANTRTEAEALEAQWLASCAQPR